MDLRSLKKEVETLPNIEHTTTKFQEHWLTPLHKKGTAKLHFLQSLTPETRAMLNRKLAQLQPHLEEIKSSQILNQRLQHHTRQLIDLKLAQYQNNPSKSRQIIRQMINDNVLSIKKTVQGIKEFEAKVSQLQEEYEEINLLLDKHLSLEETLFYMDLPHKLYLYNLIQTTKQHRWIARDIGQHFAAITKEMSLKRAARR